MKKGIFNAWFKEVVTLIFTQTIQAFLLAVVLTIIISALKTNTQNVGDGAGAAAGLLAIIALSQFSKLELLVKNIFGVTSSFGDPSLAAGRNSLTAGKAMVIGNMRRLGDNGKKIAQVGKGIGSHFKMKDLEREKAKLVSQPPKTTTDEEFRKFNNQDGEKENLNVNGGDLLRLISEQTEAIRSQTQIMERNKLDEQIKKLDDKIAEAKKDRNESFKTAAGGVVETAGALYGGVAGSMYGLAQGDNIVSSTLGGLEAGDAIGQSAFNTATSLGKTTMSVGKGAATNAYHGIQGAKSGGVKGAINNVTKAGRDKQEIAKNISKYQEELEAAKKNANQKQQAALDAEAEKYYQQVSEMFNNEAIRNSFAGRKSEGINHPIKRVKAGKVKRVQDLPKKYDIGKD